MEDTALALWREWLEQDGDPLYASEQNGDLYCFFCQEWQANRRAHTHAPDCIYIRAKRLIEANKA